MQQIGAVEHRVLVQCDVLVEAHVMLFDYASPEDAPAHTALDAALEERRARVPFPHVLERVAEHAAHVQAHDLFVGREAAFAFERHNARFGVPFEFLQVWKHAVVGAIRLHCGNALLEHLRRD